MRKYTLIILCLLPLIGCKNRMDYSDAQQTAALHLPASALPISHRYDIPKVDNKNCGVIDNLQPPYYE